MVLCKFNALYCEPLHLSRLSISEVQVIRFWVQRLRPLSGFRFQCSGVSPSGFSVQVSGVRIRTVQGMGMGQSAKGIAHGVLGTG